MIGVIAYPLGLAVLMEQVLIVAEADERQLRRRAAQHRCVYNREHIDQGRPGTADGSGLARTFPGRRLVYALLFLPFVFPIVIGTVAWYYLFSNVNGGINYLLVHSHLVNDSIAWLGVGPLPMATLITVNVWHGTALFGVLVLAALRSVPADILDAAVIDGARPLRRFTDVVLPYLSSALALGAVLSVAVTFGDFAIVHLLTGGGPANETTIVSTMHSRSLSGTALSARARPRRFR